MKYDFAGISTKNANTNFETEFETIYDDCSSFHQSREVFELNVDDDFQFKYRFCVNVTDLEEFGENYAGKYLVELQLVPTVESLCEDKRKDLFDSIGYIESEFISKDIVDSGYEVTLDYKKVNYDKLEYILESIANTYRTLNSMIGFYLDRYVNRIGTTGWDLLRDYIKGINFVEASLNKLKM